MVELVSPVSSPKAADAWQRHTNSIRPKAERSLHILLADDNAVNQRVAMHMLKRMGHRIELAATGFEAVSVSALADYDCILMDCQMPQMEGLEAPGQIRASEAEMGVDCTPFITLAASATGGDRVAGLEAGIDAYLATQ